MIETIVLYISGLSLLDIDTVKHQAVRDRTGCLSVTRAHDFLCNSPREASSSLDATMFSRSNCDK